MSADSHCVQNAQFYLGDVKKEGSQFMNSYIHTMAVPPATAVRLVTKLGRF